MTDTEQEGVSPATAGGASAPIIDLSAFRAAGKALADAYIAQSQARSAFFAGLLGGLPVDRESTTAQEADRSTCPNCWGDLPPDPRDAEIERLRGEVEELKTQRGQLNDEALRWTAIAGGHAEEIERLRKAVANYSSRLDADLAAGGELVERAKAALGIDTGSICRSVSVMGLKDTFGQLCAEIERLRDQLGEVCTALHNQLSDYDECGVFTRDHALYLVRQLGGRVRLRDMTIKAMQKDERERERKADQAYATVADERNRLRAELDALPQVYGGLVNQMIAAQRENAHVEVATLDQLAGELDELIEVLKVESGTRVLFQQQRDEAREERDVAANGLVAIRRDLDATNSTLGKLKESAEPRRWVAGDPVPEVTHGTKVRVFERADRLHGIGHITWMQKNVDPVKSRFGVALADTANTAVSYGEFEVVGTDG